MRKIFFMFAAAMTLVSCNQGFEIEANLEGTEGKWLTLSQRIDRDYVVVDSALVEAGQAVILSGEVDGVTSMYLAVKGERPFTRILVENASYTVSGSTEEPLIKGGAKAQSDLDDYNARTAILNDKVAAMNEAYRTAAARGDSLLLDSVNLAIMSAYNEKKAFDSLYIENNPASAVAVTLMNRLVYYYPTEDLERVVSSFDASLHGMEEYKSMSSILEKQKVVAVGQPYMDISLPTPEGEELSISDIHEGQVLLIDFWASWCGPCRRANPKVVGLFEKYNKQGFDIIGISRDRQLEAWKKGIEDDGLTWHHISDLSKGDNPPHELYGVPAIPYTIIVDREGIIRYRNVHGDEMEEAIRTLL